MEHAWGWGLQHGEEGRGRRKKSAGRARVLLPVYWRKREEEELYMRECARENAVLMIPSIELRAF